VLLKWPFKDLRYTFGYSSGPQLKTEFQDASCSPESWTRRQPSLNRSRHIVIMQYFSTSHVSSHEAVRWNPRVLIMLYLRKYLVFSSTYGYSVSIPRVMSRVLLRVGIYRYPRIIACVCNILLWGAMCPARRTQWISSLYGMLNKELKLWGSVQASTITVKKCNYPAALYRRCMRNCWTIHIWVSLKYLLGPESLLIYFLESEH